MLVLQHEAAMRNRPRLLKVGGAKNEREYIVDVI